MYSSVTEQCNKTKQKKNSLIKEISYFSLKSSVVSFNALLDTGFLFVFLPYFWVGSQPYKSRPPPTYCTVRSLTL